MTSTEDLNAKSKLPELQRAPVGQLAGLLLDAQWGLAQATKVPSLQELCDAMGHYYAGLQAMEAPSQALAGLIPMMIRDCDEELHERHAPPADFKVLMAARLIWACPKLGPRGLAAAQRAWVRVWDRRAEASAALDELKA